MPGTAICEPACGMARPLADEAFHYKRFGRFAENWNREGTFKLDRSGTFAEHWRNRKDMPMLATALTLALFGLVTAILVNLVRQNGRKIVAALEGRSWTAQPPVSKRPVTVRFSPRYRAAEPVRPALRAAA